jgi:hypothetical protein
MPIGTFGPVVANRFIYRLRDPRRGEIVVFNAPAKAATPRLGHGFRARA